MSLLEETAAPAAARPTTSAAHPALSDREARALTDAERDRLAELERVIDRGLEAFLASGRALCLIRDEVLYRDHGTFKQYVAARWDVSLPRAYSLMYSAEVADALQAGGEAPVVTESALRELAPVLKRDGPTAVVGAYLLVMERHEGRKPPSAARVRASLLDVGLVDRPPRPWTGSRSAPRRLDDRCQARLRAQPRAPFLSPHDRSLKVTDDLSEARQPPPHPGVDPAVIDVLARVERVAVGLLVNEMLTPQRLASLS